MPVLDNLSCITDLVDVRNECQTQTGVVYWLDDNGISLAKSAHLADERYVTGQNLVDQKVRIALNDVYRHLTRNLHPTNCDYDKATGILCDRADQVAAAVWYRATALIYKEQIVDSSRYNEYIQFAGGEAIANMLYYDSSFSVFTTADNIPAGLYQRELEKLEAIRLYMEQNCCTECTGSRWQVVLP